MADTITEFFNAPLTVSSFAGGLTKSIITTDANTTVVLRDLTTSVPDNLVPYKTKSVPTVGWVNFSPPSPFLSNITVSNATVGTGTGPIKLLVNGTTVAEPDFTSSIKLSGTELVGVNSTVTLLATTVPIAAVEPSTTFHVSYILSHSSSAANSMFAVKFTAGIPSTSELIQSNSTAPLGTSVQYWYIGSNVFYMYFDGNSDAKLYKRTSLSGVDTMVAQAPSYGYWVYDGADAFYSFYDYSNSYRKYTISTGLMTTLSGTGFSYAMNSYPCSAYANGYMFGTYNSYPTQLQVLNVTTGVCTTLSGLTSASFANNNSMAAKWDGTNYWIYRRIEGILYISKLDSNRTLVSNTQITLAGSDSYRSNFCVNGTTISYAYGANLYTYSFSGTLLATTALSYTPYQGVLSSTPIVRTFGTTITSTSSDTVAGTLRVTGIKTV